MSDSRAEQIALGQTQVLTQTLKLLAAEPKLDTFLSHVLAAIPKRASRLTALTPRASLR